MASVNKVILVGNLGADPDFRQFENGCVASVSLATTEHWKDKKSGEQREHTEWHRVVFYNRLAEIVRDHLRKGSQIYIEGRNQTRGYTADDQTTRYVTEVVASEMQMLGKKPEGERTQNAPIQPARIPLNSGNDWENDLPYE